MKLLPVSLVVESEAVTSAPFIASAASTGVIHVELSGEARIRFEGLVDPATVRAVLESVPACLRFRQEHGSGSQPV